MHSLHESTLKTDNLWEKNTRQHEPPRGSLESINKNAFCDVHGVGSTQLLAVAVAHKPEYLEQNRSILLDATRTGTLGTLPRSVLQS